MAGSLMTGSQPTGFTRLSLLTVIGRWEAMWFQVDDRPYAL